jgi:rSAM/selenodomain-associated transferase 2
MDIPKLSIIIPTLNEAGHLPSILADLNGQQDISVEVVVGDGGSSDATLEIADKYGVHCVLAKRGRGIQMNAAAAKATGEYLLFLHADSRIDAPLFLNTAVASFRREMEEGGGKEIAGHFCLQFIRTSMRNTMAYRYAEEKTAFNRVNTTNGDQGLLISRDFFRRLGGFDEGLPFLEDQRIVEKIRANGKLITLPGHIKTSARRFEAEGFHRRYTLMSMMMGLYSVGERSFFVRAPGVYQVQQNTGKLCLSSFFGLIWKMMRDDWGLRGSIRVFYRLGRYIRQNSWQMFYFFDISLRSLLGTGRYPFLYFHDRVFAPCTNFKVFNAIVGAFCFIWFMGILAPYYWIIDYQELKYKAREDGA